MTDRARQQVARGCEREGRMGGLVRGKWQGHPKEFSYAVRRKKKKGRRRRSCRKIAGDIKSNKKWETRMGVMGTGTGVGAGGIKR